MALRSSAETAARWLRCLSWMLALPLASPISAYGLELLSESELSAVAGKDGLSLGLESTAGFEADRITYQSDRGAAAPLSCTGGTANQHACVDFKGVSATGDGGPLQMNATVDAGYDGTAPAMALKADWGPMQLTADSISLRGAAEDASARSFGSVSLYGSGNMQLTNRNGLFNGAADAATLNFSLGDPEDSSDRADLIYRQGAAGTPELSFGNMFLGLRFSNGAAAGQLDGRGTVGIDENGVFLAADAVDFDLAFDVLFKDNATGFDRSGRDPMILLGWQGGLQNYRFSVGAGGYGYDTYSVGSDTFHDVDGAITGNRSQGINVLAEWDFDSDFQFLVGEAGGNRTQVRMGAWQRMAGSSGPMLSMPVIFDVLQNGATPGGLCFGGGFASGSPTAGTCAASGGNWEAASVDSNRLAVAALIRDGHLHAYNTEILVIDPANTTIPASTYNWSLLYTFGKLDADILLYPDGRADGLAPVSTNTGLRMDTTLAIQSPGHWAAANSSSAAVRAGAGANWSTNTHFMVADTNVAGSGDQYGFGMINADLLWKVRDMYLRVTDGDSAYPGLPGGLWLQTDNFAQYRFRGLFGGGDLQDLSNPSVMGLVDINLQTDKFIFVLNPAAGSGGSVPVGFNGLLNFDGNAYLSLAEVSSPQSAFEISDVSGTVAWRDGTVSLQSGQNTPDNLPRLSIENDLLLGTSATFGGGAGNPLVGNVGFGGEYFGRIAMPAGTWNSNVTVKIPGN